MWEALTFLAFIFDGLYTTIQSWKILVAILTNQLINFATITIPARWMQLLTTNPNKIINDNNNYNNRKKNE